MEPMARPPLRCLGLPQPVHLRQINDGPNLGDAVPRLQLALQENRLAFAIPADAILTPAEGPASLIHSEILGLQIEAGDTVLIASQTTSVGVRRHVLSRPLAD